MLPVILNRLNIDSEVKRMEIIINEQEKDRLYKEILYFEGVLPILLEPTWELTDRIEYLEASGIWDKIQQQMYLNRIADKKDPEFRNHQLLQFIKDNPQFKPLIKEIKE